MDWSWIGTSWSAAWMTVVTAAGVYATVIVYTRLMGLRSFSKMSSFDFAMTVAVGSMVAATILTPDPPLLRAAVALAAVYLFQYVLAVLRRRVGLVERLVDNRPVLLMEDGRPLEAALRATQVTWADVLAKLRAANVQRLEQVRAVVLETTGDITVLHDGADAGDAGGTGGTGGVGRGALEELLEDVRRV